jgi:hypothetical protein
MARLLRQHRRREQHVQRRSPTKTGLFAVAICIGTILLAAATKPEVFGRLSVNEGLVMVGGSPGELDR